jgi:hypothetical protein
MGQYFGSLPFFEPRTQHFVGSPRPFAVVASMKKERKKEKGHDKKNGIGTFDSYACISAKSHTHLQLCNRHVHHFLRHMKLKTQINFN